MARKRIFIIIFIYFLKRKMQMVTAELNQDTLALPYDHQGVSYDF